ncbi:GNAT family N-acetyltransferase [Pseudochryseolinea flava]|uniref:GNAT family N-acetyltransferase n=1 Tax=Pseudochryseolinea flava TaxID=2059302 RepID=A0A364XYS3_9BACT|nr:N-acetyltransferase [Pseudochryseolinea flava]RAV99430.1 GNAT family N-acetyltransferase [Pseudochryseolinea flava]
MTVFSIRIATIDDAPLLQRLGSKTFSDTFSAFNTAENMKRYIEKNFSSDKVKEELLDTNAQTILLHDGAECVGFARLRRGGNPVEIQGKAIEIERIYVEKDYIGGGVGNALMQECIRRAKEDGVEVIWLGVWEHNPRAIRFYEKNGFKKFSEHVFMLGDDAQTDWLMRKDLN